MHSHKMNAFNKYKQIQFGRYKKKTQVQSVTSLRYNLAIAPRNIYIDIVSLFVLSFVVLYIYLLNIYLR